MSDEQDKDIRRKILEETAKNIKKKADESSLVAANVQKDMNEISDAADLMIQTAKYGYKYADWESAINAAHRLENDISQTTPLFHHYVRVHPMISSSTADVTYFSSNLVSGSYSGLASETERKNAELVYKGYQHFFERYKYREEVLSLLAELGLDKTTVGKVAIRKFKDAWGTYIANPPYVDTSIGTAIPLRSVIDIVINELFRLKPNQKESKQKIIEIGTQLRYDEISLDVFMEIDSEIKKLDDRLSGSKDRYYSRQTEFELMISGTLILKRLLSVIDPQKLRKRRSK